MNLGMIIDFFLSMLGGLTLLILIESVKIIDAWLRTEDDL
jgi:hypothetical protein